MRVSTARAEHSNIITHEAKQTRRAGTLCRKRCTDNNDKRETTSNELLANRKTAPVYTWDLLGLRKQEGRTRLRNSVHIVIAWGREGAITCSHDLVSERFNTV